MARVPALSMVCLLAAGTCFAADDATGAAAAATPAAATADAPATAAAPAADALSPEDAKLRAEVSYSVGQQMAESVTQYELDPAEVLRGLKDTIDGKAAPIDQTKLGAEIRQYQQELGARQHAAADKRKAEFDKNNPDWMAAMAKKKGVIATPSGLLYEIIASGTGRQPTQDDTVSVNYKGALPDGTVFDESAKHGGPATFQLKGVIKGWTEAVSMMKEGDKWKVYLPAELAYGANPPPGSGIPANSPLVFEIELIKVLPPQGGPGGGMGGQP